MMLMWPPRVNAIQRMKSNGNIAENDPARLDGERCGFPADQPDPGGPGSSGGDVGVGEVEVGQPGGVVALHAQRFGGVALEHRDP